MGKSIREQDEQQNNAGRREGGEQFNTDSSREGFDENSANSEEQTNPESGNDAKKGGMGSGQRQDSN